MPIPEPDDRTRRLEPIAVVGARLRSPGGGDTFDAPFFEIPASQAPHVGPAERVLLETAWEALENATIDPATLEHDRGAVYVGGSAPNLAPDRLASFLGWRAPATGGASAPAALHLAVAGLRGRDCEIALCGAVNTPHDQVVGGCGVLVLKRLPDARRDGDTVLAIVRGTATAAAGFDPGDIQYVEPGGVGAVIETGFGLTGAIGVAVLDEAPRPPATGLAEPPPAPLAAHVFTLSAKSAPALRRQRERYRRFVAGNPDADLADLCYTGNVGRTHFRHRLAGGVRTRDELLALLDTGAQAHPARRATAFLFAGAGPEHVGMGKPCYDRFPEFRTRVDECEKLFFVELGRSVTDVMFGRVPDAAAVLGQTRYAHAALFTLEYALACLWRSWGVHPAVLIGHGVGELVAATVAGVFSPADAAAFLSARARLIESVATPGGMAAVAAPADQVAAVAGQCPDLAIAAVNSPRQCVMSGATGSLMAAFIRLTQLGLHVRPLQVATGFHSPVLAEIAEGLRAVLDGIELHQPTLPVISSRTGKPAAAAEITTPDYWVRQVTGTVDFAAGMAAIGERGGHVLLEIGPSHVLTALARQCLPDQRHTMLASLDPDDTTGATVAGTLADLYTAGLPISWPDVHDGHSRRRTALPHYAFDSSPPGRRAGAGMEHDRPAAVPTRRELLADVIRRTVADLLPVDGTGRVDPHADLRRLGVDSLVAVELRSRLESRLHVSFPILAMYEQLSVDRLAEFLERQLIGPADE